MLQCCSYVLFIRFCCFGVFNKTWSCVSGESRNRLHRLRQTARKRSAVPPQTHHCRCLISLPFRLKQITHRIDLCVFVFSRDELLFPQPRLQPPEADRKWEWCVLDGRHGSHQRVGGCRSGALTLWLLWHCYHDNTQDTAWLPLWTHLLQER